MKTSTLPTSPEGAKQKKHIMSHVHSYHHIIIRTKNSTNSLQLDQSHRLYAYIRAIVHNKKCELHCINGIENHIHLLVNMHQDVPLSYLVRDIKAESSKFIKNTLLNRQFISWNEKYFGVSCSLDDRDRIKAYFDNQREHHKKIPFKTELEEIAKSLGIVLDPRDWE